MQARLPEITHGQHLQEGVEVQLRAGRGRNAHVKRHDGSLRHDFEQLVEGGVFRVGASLAGRRHRKERSCEEREVQQDTVQGTDLLEVGLVRAVVAARSSSSEVGSLRQWVGGGVGLTATCSRGSSVGAKGILSRSDHGGRSKEEPANNWLVLLRDRDRNLPSPPSRWLLRQPDWDSSALDCQSPPRAEPGRRRARHVEKCSDSCKLAGELVLGGEVGKPIGTAVVPTHPGLRQTCWGGSRRERGSGQRQTLSCSERSFPHGHSAHGSAGGAPRPVGPEQEDSAEGGRRCVSASARERRAGCAAHLEIRGKPVVRQLEMCIDVESGLVQARRSRSSMGQGGETMGHVGSCGLSGEGRASRLLHGKPPQLSISTVRRSAAGSCA